ncbi:MAG TPA: cupin domain-containing protein [Hyphomonadaceae bacterium]|nr:cupin domain-containing protein [Hyphomonadaceae bacterium]
MRRAPESASGVAMSHYDNTYAAFMLDYAAGSLSPAETLAGDLHCALSRDGGRNGLMLEAIGGVLLERAEPKPPGYFDTAKLGRPLLAGEAGPASGHLDEYIKRDLLALKWNKSIFGVQTRATSMPNASLLRLDPGQRAPAHGHGRRDVTVVLRGSFADQYGVYERGDVAFAEPGMKHEPRAVGDETCVCLLAAEPGSSLHDLLGYLGLGRLITAGQRVKS